MSTSAHKQTCFSPPQGCSCMNVGFCSSCCRSVVLINKNSSRSQIPVSYINALMQRMENMINDMLKAFT